MRVSCGWIVGVLLAGKAVIQPFAQEPTTDPPRPIEPPAAAFPSEAASARVSRFSFIAYGDTRSPVDGRALQPDHGALIDNMLAAIATRSTTRFPVKLVLHSGDAVARGIETLQWDVSFSPLVEKLTRGVGVWYFYAAGNHDAPALPASRAIGLRNTMAAVSKLIPAEGSPRRLSGYLTYTVGYGNVFAMAIDSNIADDRTQLAWITNQLEQLDRSRYRHIVAFFHHPMFSSGPHGGSSPGASSASGAADNVEAQTAAMRSLYGPLFRRHHVRMTITGHDHLHEHWVERYTDGNTAYRMDHVVTGGGGAPIYAYRGEPEVAAYLASGAAQRVRLEHLMKPGTAVAENPHHFVVIQVDGDRLWQEVIGIGAAPYRPYNGQSRIALNDPSASR
jgi:Calcineurin-like phosphoesterase